MRLKEDLGGISSCLHYRCEAGFERCDGEELIRAEPRATQKAWAAQKWYIGILHSLFARLPGGIGVRVFTKFTGRVSGFVLAGAVAGLLVSGCETGRTYKLHTDAAHVSDETTTSKPDPNYVGNGEGQPPVPGSPTAAGVDGKQPFDSAYARPSPGAEHGIATPPSEQAKDSFERQ